MLSTTESISELFALIYAGNKQAFDALFHGYYRRLVLFAQQYTRQYEAAEEIVAEVFIKLWLKRVMLNKVNKPEVYLYTAVKNTALNYLRSANKITIAADEDFAGGEALSIQPHDQKELHQVINKLIAALPEQRRMTFILIKENGLKSSEVAAILGISQRTVENHLYKAVKYLADGLSSYLGYHPQRQYKRKIMLFNLFMYCW